MVWFALLSAPGVLAGCAGHVDGSEADDTGEPVIGGTEAVPNSAPWMVQIGRPSAGYPHWCGGSLLPGTVSGGTLYLVTAAHCVYGFPNDFVIKAGEHNLTTSESTEQVRSAAAIIIHPEYDPSTIRNDIAIIRVNSAVMWNASAQPIEMPDGRYDTAFTPTIYGWGQTIGSDPNSGSNVLMKADLPIIDQATCGAALGGFVPVLPGMICAGYPDSAKGGCHGDSGGPLIAKNGAGTPQLAGIVSWGNPICTQYGVFTRVVDYVPWIRSITIGQPFSCQGQTPAGYTNWQQYNADGIYLDVDTSQCDSFGTIQYFTSLGGNSSHFTARGATSIYSPTENGFRVYVNRSGITAAQANTWNWHLNWQGVPLNQSRSELCTGRTTPGTTNWVQNTTNSVYVDVDTSRCNRTTTPRYFTSLGGTSNHWTTLGATSIYSPTPTGFRIYIDQGGITPALANQRNYHINWAATPSSAQTNVVQCTGNTAAGAGWVQNTTNSIYLDVNTSSCNRSVKPVYFTSLGGQSSHYQAYGGTSIYQATATGFRVYLNQSGITPAVAATRGYFINWGAYR